jgi:hypothetical protein
VENPTPYAKVNALLRRALEETQAILGSGFTGFYLYGSLAAGGFDPVKSDIDFLTVTEADLDPSTVLALGRMHARLAASGLPLATALDGSYIPKAALRRYDPANARHPHLESGGVLVVEQHGPDWVIHRHMAREHGLPLAGPDLRQMIDPISAGELRAAARATLKAWWEPMIAHPSRLREPDYRAYAILTMARILYTLENGTVVPKPVAARWAQSTLARPWSALIKKARSWPNDPQPGSLREAQDFIRYTLEHSQQFEHGLEPEEGSSQGSGQEPVPE